LSRKLLNGIRTGAELLAISAVINYLDDGGGKVHLKLR
jgi:hypothetical protein